MRLLAVKLVLTALVWLLLRWSLSVPGQGILGELAVFGPVVTAAVIVAFLILVALYCHDLQRLIAAIRPGNRAASPRSVWLMFAVPYNFIEDFFIVANVAASIRAEATRHPDLARGPDPFGMVAGMGWCGLQIVSLVPHSMGSLAGMLALPLWLWHWRRVRQVRAMILTGR